MVGLLVYVVNDEEVAGSIPLVALAFFVLYNRKGEKERWAEPKKTHEEGRGVCSFVQMPVPGATGAE